MVDAAPPPLVEAGIDASADAGAGADASTVVQQAPPEEPVCAGPVYLDEARARVPACRVLKERNLKVLRAIKPIIDNGGGGFNPEEASGVCFPLAGGAAWGVLVTGPKISGDVSRNLHELTASWSAAHVDASGRVVVSKQAQRYTATPYGATVFRGPPDNHSAIFDYDGDGEPEIVLLAGQSEHAGSGDYSALVWTFKGGKVTTYDRAPGGIVNTDDADCDGRPDLRLDEPYRASVNCSSLQHTSVLGAHLLAHSLPDGGFSLADAVAEAAARERCAQKPPALNAADAEDERALLDRVRCARLWGVPSADVVKQLQAVCKPPRKDETCGNKRPGVCVEMATLLRWARATPPLTLR